MSLRGQKCGNFQHFLDSGTLLYTNGCLVNADAPVHLTSIQVDPNSDEVRTHYERLTIATNAAEESEASKIAEFSLPNRSDETASHWWNEEDLFEDGESDTEAFVPDVYDQLLGDNALSSRNDEQSPSNNWNLGHLFGDGGNETALKETVSDFEKPPKNRSVDENRNETVLKDGSHILELLGMVEPGSDASSAENDAEDLSNSSSDGEDSDAEDVFKLNAMKPEQ